MDQLNDNTIFDEFSVDGEIKSNLADISRWASINAIVGFVSLGLSIISFIITMGRLSEYGASSSGAAGGGIFSLIIGAAISLLLNITLLQAASNLKKGIEGTDQTVFGIGLTKLATYFRIVGVLTIIVLAIFVLAILFGILLGSGRSF